MSLTRAHNARPDVEWQPDKQSRDVLHDTNFGQMGVD